MFRIFAFLFLPLFLLGADDPGYGSDFSSVDAHARSIKKATSIEKTAELLTAPYENDMQKVRAIFIWITENVNYDVKRAINSKGKTKRTRIVANSEEELARIRLDREKNKAKLAFKSGKGVCENYAFLFLFMCQHIGIEAELVGGFGRNDPSLIGKTLRGSNHAWNRVKIDDKWYLLDATWAAGTIDLNKGRYKKQYREGFFLSDPKYFVLSHFPDDPSLQLLKKPLSKDTFTDSPLGHHALSSGDIYDYFPLNGLLKNSNGGITLKIWTKDPGATLILLDNRSRTLIPKVIDGDQVSFTINRKNLKGHELTIAKIVENETIPILSYKVI
jgi:hypothetical protein